ncbi:unnamed protein product [Amoebophrya sp. A120]|nr:unnamed protein product [Amoebophrya sp. A120]|eukprot:GSA120T00001617001.1
MVGRIQCCNVVVFATLLGHARSMVEHPNKTTPDVSPSTARGAFGDSNNLQTITEFLKRYDPENAQEILTQSFVGAMSPMPMPRGGEASETRVLRDALVGDHYPVSEVGLGDLDSMRAQTIAEPAAELEKTDQRPIARADSASSCTAAPRLPWLPPRSESSKRLRWEPPSSTGSLLYGSPVEGVANQARAEQQSARQRLDFDADEPETTSSSPDGRQVPNRRLAWAAPGALQQRAQPPAAQPTLQQLRRERESRRSTSTPAGGAHAQQPSATGAAPAVQRPQIPPTFQAGYGSNPFQTTQTLGSFPLPQQSQPAPAVYEQRYRTPEQLDEELAREPPVPAPMPTPDTTTSDDQEQESTSRSNYGAGSASHRGRHGYSHSPQRREFQLRRQGSRSGRREPSGNYPDTTSAGNDPSTSSAQEETTTNPTGPTVPAINLYSTPEPQQRRIADDTPIRQIDLTTTPSGAGATSTSARTTPHETATASSSSRERRSQPSSSSRPRSGSREAAYGLYGGSSSSRRGHRNERSAAAGAAPETGAEPGQHLPGGAAAPQRPEHEDRRPVSSTSREHRRRRSGPSTWRNRSSGNPSAGPVSSAINSVLGGGLGLAGPSLPASRYPAHPGPQSDERAMRRVASQPRLLQPAGPVSSAPARRRNDSSRVRALLFMNPEPINLRAGGPGVVDQGGPAAGAGASGSGAAAPAPGGGARVFVAEPEAEPEAAARGRLDFHQPLLPDYPAGSALPERRARSSGATITRGDRGQRNGRMVPQPFY